MDTEGVLTCLSVVCGALVLCVSTLAIVLVQVHGAGAAFQADTNQRLARMERVLWPPIAGTLASFGGSRRTQELSRRHGWRLEDTNDGTRSADRTH